MIYLMALLGGLSNRVRGGLFHLPRWLALTILGVSYAVLLLSAGVPYLVAGLGSILFVASMTPGWGTYIGTMGGWSEVKPEWPPIDWIIGSLTDSPFWYGFMGLFFRGMLIGIALSAVTGIYGILIGLSMPIWYLAGIEIEKGIFERKGWESAEILYGMFIFSAVYGILS